MPVAQEAEVHTGQATILSNVSGTQVEEYTVEILKVYDDSRDTRDLMLRVTDPRPLEQTGGIVQGMSGSPILQDGKLVGAVTHVLVDHADRGYGILAQKHAGPGPAGPDHLTPSRRPAFRLPGYLLDLGALAMIH